MSLGLARPRVAVSVTGLAGKLAQPVADVGPRYSRCVHYGEPLVTLYCSALGLCLCSGGHSSIIDYLLHNIVGAVI